jgi:hypothetical protein
MAKNISQVRSGNGPVRSIANPQGNVGAQNQPTWGDKTPKPQNLNPAPPTGPVAVGRDTKATPMVSNPEQTSVTAADTGPGAPEDQVGTESKS